MVSRVMHYIRTHRWVVLAVIGGAAGCLFTWNALHSGWMNEYYSAAVLSGSSDWRSFFYASFDTQLFVSVDKPPLGLWFSAVSVLLFGLSPIAIALPHIIAGVLTTITLFELVARVGGRKVALLAVSSFLSMPIVGIMFGYNQPDSLLTLWMTLSLYTFYRSLTSKQLRWIVATSVLLGLGFLTKTLQILPLVAVYISLAVYNDRKHLVTKDFFIKVIAAIIPFIIISAWWPLIVSLTPPTDRPYVGSTTDNSPWSLILGYNGIDRFTQPHQTATQYVASGVAFGGQPGVSRLINEEFGPNSGWYLLLIIPALIGITLRRAHIRREHLVLVGVSLAWVGAYGVLFSSMRGIIHPYYVLILAPALAIVAAFGVKWMLDWYKSRVKGLRYILPGVVASSAFLSAILLQYDATILSPYAVGVACGGMVVAVLLVSLRSSDRLHNLVGILTIGLLLVGPLSYVIYSATVSHRGPFPSARSLDSAYICIPETAIAFLTKHHGDQRWLVATESVSYAAPIQIASRQPVMAIGGYNGTDPILSLAALKTVVNKGEVRYFITSAQTTYTSLPNDSFRWLTSQPIAYEDDQVRIYSLLP